MAVPKHLDEAVARLKDASARIDQARAKPFALDAVRAWLVALTEYALALADVQTFNNESIHEKLHELAGHAGLRQFPPARSQGGRRQSPLKGGRRG